MRTCEEGLSKPRTTQANLQQWGFDNMVNPLGNCLEYNLPEHVRRNCPVWEQSRTSHNGGLKKNVCCYNWDKAGHYLRTAGCQRGQEMTNDLCSLWKPSRGWPRRWQHRMTRSIDCNKSVENFVEEECSQSLSGSYPRFRRLTKK